MATAGQARQTRQFLHITLAIEESARRGEAVRLGNLRVSPRSSLVSDDRELQLTDTGNKSMQIVAAHNRAHT